MYKTERETIIKKQEAITVQKVEELRAELNIEIERLTLLVNVYKEKLTRRETENRNLLVELQQLKKWKENYQNLNQKYNGALEEIDKLKAEIKELIEKYQK